MDKNVGGVDRWTRLAAGGILIAYGTQARGWKRWLAMTLGGNLVSTAVAQRCYVNKLLDINTNQAEETKKKEDALVDEASLESFPASDPPAYTAGVA